MPPKNMISVTRNSHMPSEAAFFCCWASAKWWSSAGRVRHVSSLTIAQRLRFGLWNLVVVVSLPGHDGRLIKIERWAEGMVFHSSPAAFHGLFGDRAVAQRPQEVNHRQQVTDGQHVEPAVESTFSTWNSGGYCQ